MYTEMTRMPDQPKNADEIRQILEDEIAGGQHAPGTRLEELVLAKRFGVSRTPVREALRILSASGLIELKPRKGAVVAPLSLERLVEMFETMAEMEGVCGALAARRMTPGELTVLRHQHFLCGEAAQSGDADHYYAENARFHALIYAGCHNDFLVEEVQRLRRRLQPYRRLQLRLKGRIADSFAEHQAIVEVLDAGDETAAAQLLKAHISIQSHRFADWVSGLNANRWIPEKQFG